MNHTRQQQREHQQEYQRRDERRTQQEPETPEWGKIIRDPRESIDWRRHRHGCPYYRERWFPQSEPEAGEPMYQVFCMMNTPPESWTEQDKCLASRTRCWRLTEGKLGAQPHDAPDIPLGSVGRRTPTR